MRMLRFRYTQPGHWYKGNTHLHSIVSDGRKTALELGTLYRQAGYDFLCLTDHWVSSRCNPALTQEGLLWINGVELNGEDSRGIEYHYVALGDFHGIDKTLTLEQALESVQQQGAFLILAHPFWMGLNFEDSERFSIQAVELYNHICQWENGKGDGLVFWQHLLSRDTNTLGIACDDAHFHREPDVWQGGWLMVNAQECTQPAILAALRTGAYYSSCGPDFKRIALRGNKVEIDTSPVKTIRLVGPAHRARTLGVAEGQVLESVSFEIPEAWAYVYIEIEDHHRRRAWTNTLFY